MKQNEILQQRRESFLKEILNEALGNLKDERLNTLEVTRVECSKGKHDAKVFVESSDKDKTEKENIRQAFNRARPLIQDYILNATSWFNAPKLSLEFDESFAIQKRLDAIFTQIEQRQKG